MTSFTARAAVGEHLENTMIKAFRLEDYCTLSGRGRRLATGCDSKSEDVNQNEHPLAILGEDRLASTRAGGRGWSVREFRSLDSGPAAARVDRQGFKPHRWTRPSTPPSSRLVSTRSPRHSPARTHRIGLFTSGQAQRQPSTDTASRPFQRPAPLPVIGGRVGGCHEVANSMEKWSSTASYPR
jgi:hypothetical protein